jgi:outer membrane protein TolC
MSSLAFSANIFSKYYRDEGTFLIELEEPEYAGRLEKDKLYLTEREAIEMALVNNLEINVERHSSLTSQWDIKLQESYYDPKGIFGYDFNRLTNPSTSVLQGGESVTDMLSGYTFGYQHPFSTGTSLDVSFIGNRTDTTNFFAGIVPAIRTEVHFFVRQDLLRGFGKSAAEYEIEISRNNLDITGQEFKRRVTDIIVQVQDRFWELQAALKAVEVTQKAHEYAKTVYEQNQARFEVGTAARLEVVQAEAELASRKEEMVSAQFTYRRVQDQLVQLISDFEDPRTFQGEIIPVEESDPVPPDDKFDKLLEIAVEMRPEMQQADLGLSNFNIRHEQSRDNLRPQLDLVAGYQQYGLGGNSIIRDFSQWPGVPEPPIIDIIPGGLGDSLNALGSSDFKGFVVGLNLALPIKNSESKAQNAKAQIDLRRAKLKKRSLRQLIALEIRDAMTQVEMNEARLEASSTAVKAAEERLEAEEARFEVGLGTTRELIEAQRDLLQSISVEVRSEMDLRKSLAQLDKAVGRTFEKNNIVLTDALNRNVKRLEP